MLIAFGYDVSYLIVMVMLKFVYHIKGVIRFFTKVDHHVFYDLGSVCFNIIDSELDYFMCTEHTCNKC